MISSSVKYDIILVGTFLFFIDQIFTFVFKYRGYERIYATLSYSKIIIDEIQGYSPEIVAIIIKLLIVLHITNTLESFTFSFIKSISSNILFSFI